MIAASADNHWLITAGADGTVRLWSLSLEELIRLATAIAGWSLVPAVE